MGSKDASPAQQLAAFIAKYTPARRRLVIRAIAKKQHPRRPSLIAARRGRARR